MARGRELESSPRGSPASPRPPQVVSAVSNGVRPAIPADCDEGLTGLMLGCWSESPGLRPSFQQVLATLAPLCAASASGRHATELEHGAGAPAEDAGTPYSDRLADADADTDSRLGGYARGAATSFTVDS